MCVRPISPLYTAAREPEFADEEVVSLTCLEKLLSAFFLARSFFIWVRRERSFDERVFDSACSSTDFLGAPGLFEPLLLRTFLGLVLEEMLLVSVLARTFAGADLCFDAFVEGLGEQGLLFGACLVVEAEESTEVRLFGFELEDFEEATEGRDLLAFFASSYERIFPWLAKIVAPHSIMVCLLFG